MSAVRLSAQTLQEIYDMLTAYKAEGGCDTRVPEERERVSRINRVLDRVLVAQKAQARAEQDAENDATYRLLGGR